MDKNRRRFLRKAPDELTVIQIERDEVGKVLNISEGGLSFSSVMPVPRNLPVYFWFSFNLKDKIEAMGEVAWTDISRTVGGLKFTQISQAGREQIKKWLSRLRTEEIPPEVPEEIEVVDEEIPEEEECFAAQLVASGGHVLRMQARMNEPGAMKTSELDRVAKFVSKARARRPIASFAAKIAEPKPSADLRVVAPASALTPQPALAVTPQPVAAAAGQQPALAVAQPLALESELPNSGSYRSMFSMESGFTKAGALADSKFPSLSFKGIESLVELVPLQRYLSAKKRQLLCGVLLGVCLSAAVMIPVMKFWNSRAHADMKTAATDPPSLKTNNNAVAEAPITAAPTTAAQAKPTYPVAGIFSDPIPPRNVPLKKGTTPDPTARKQPANAYRQDILKAVVAKIPKPPAGASQPQSNGDSSTSKKSGVNPTQLWSAVQAGNSKAAVELAELYIQGNGVPQNCQQARVLLLVASEKRNTAAIKRLQELDKGAACP